MASFKSDGMAILLVFVGAIIAITMILPIANQVILNTNDTTRYNNETVACPSSANGTTCAEGRSLITILNISDAQGLVDSAYTAENYTLYTRRCSGVLSVVLFANDSGFTNCSGSGGFVNISYIGVPKGYVGNASRSIVLLVILFSALAVLVYTIVTLIKRGSLGGILSRG